MIFAEIPLRIRLVKSESNLHSHLQWLEYIAGPDFLRDWGESIEAKKNIQALIDSARLIVEEDIYAYNTTTGSGRIKDSMQGAILDGGIATLAVYSDPRVAPSEGPFTSGNPADFSYAAFFEDPQFNSFIPPRESPLDSRRYRPFFDPMTEDHHNVSKQFVFQALLSRIRRRMPKRQT